MAKVIKVSDAWTTEEIQSLISEMERIGVEGIVVSDSECEVYDGDLEKITIEGEEVLEEKRFSGDSLFGVK